MATLRFSSAVRCWFWLRGAAPIDLWSTNQPAIVSNKPSHSDVRDLPGWVTRNRSSSGLNVLNNGQRQLLAKGSRKRRKRTWCGSRSPTSARYWLLDDIQRWSRHEVEAGAGTASGIRVSHDIAERGGRTDPSEGHAGHPDDRRGGVCCRTEPRSINALQEAIGDLGVIPPASNHNPPATKAVTTVQWRTYAY